MHYVLIVRNYKNDQRMHVPCMQRATSEGNKWRVIFVLHVGLARLNELVEMGGGDQTIKTHITLHSFTPHSLSRFLTHSLSVTLYSSSPAR